MAFLKSGYAFEGLFSGWKKRVSFACLFQIALVAVAVLSGDPSVLAGSGTMVSSRAGEIPGFVFGTFHASNSGSVYGVHGGRHADIVLIFGGFDSGFRPGMVCRVLEDGTDAGEIILVDVRENCSAALIRDLKPEQVIVPGQSVRIKTVNL